MTKYAVLSDIHANSEALTTVLDKCRELQVDEYICLGDIVGYNAEPADCLEIVKNLNPIAVVRGNHDEYASNNDERMEGFNPHAKKAVLWTKSHLTEDQRHYLSQLPFRMTVRGTNITLVHATLDSPEAWGYIFDSHHAADNFTYQFTQLCFCGHSHVPIAFYKKPISSVSERPIDEIPNWARIDDNEDFSKEGDPLEIELQTGYKYLINVGSVGQPRNRDPRASFVVYDTDAKRLTRYRMPYDVASTQSKIRNAHLPERLAARLETGN